MAQWATFAGITGVVLVLLLVLSHLTQSAFTDGTDSQTHDGTNGGTVGESTIDTPRPATEQVDPAPSTPSVTPDQSSETDEDGATDSSVREPASPSEPSDYRRSRDPAQDQAGNDRSESANRSPVDGQLAQDRDRSAGEYADEFDPDQPPRPQDRFDRRDRQVDPESLSTGMVLANVAASQGLFALVLIGAAIYTGIPATHLGIEFSGAYLETGLVLGTAFGFVLYVGNEIGAAAATRFGFDHDEGLRELLAPDAARGWAVLLVGVLPIIALFEELLFRAALIGAMSAGFGVSPWLLAIGSSIAFALGHGMQGRVGILVTGLLGFVLAAGFIYTGSFLVVVVAHYWINALEFVVHEALGFDWAETIEN